MNVDMAPKVGCCNVSSDSRCSGYNVARKDDKAENEEFHDIRQRNIAAERCYDSLSPSYLNSSLLQERNICVQESSQSSDTNACRSSVKRQRSDRLEFNINTALCNLRLESIPHLFPTLRIGARNENRSNRTNHHTDLQSSHQFISLESTRTRNEASTDDVNDAPAWVYIMERDTEGDNLLLVAIISGMTELALVMINLVPDYHLLSAQNDLFQSALHLAALTDNHVIARRLIVAGARVDLQDHNGNTALHIACIHGNYKMAEVLLSPVQYEETRQNSYTIPLQVIPQNMGIRNYNGQDCLALAVSNGHKHLGDLLLDKGADINSKDLKCGKTVLHLAAESGDVELVDLLCSKHGVDINAETYAGYTPIELAVDRYHCAVVARMLSKGAICPRTVDEIEGDYEGMEW